MDDDLMLPEFLRVENRVPLTEAQQKRYDEINKGRHLSRWHNDAISAITQTEEIAMRDDEQAETVALEETTEPKKRVRGGSLTKRVAPKKAAVRVAPKKAAVKKVAKAAASNGAARGAKQGSKMQVIKGLLTRAKGWSIKEVLEATGWPSVSLQDKSEKLGLKLRKEKKPGELTRYFGS